jgi:hypothetical protein
VSALTVACQSGGSIQTSGNALESNGKGECRSKSTWVIGGIMTRAPTDNNTGGLYGRITQGALSIYAKPHATQSNASAEDSNSLCC